MSQTTEERQSNEVRRIANARYVESIGRIAGVFWIFCQCVQNAQVFPGVRPKIVVSKSRARSHVDNEDDRQQPESRSGATGDASGQSDTLPLLRDAKGVSQSKARDVPRRLLSSVR